MKKRAKSKCDTCVIKGYSPEFCKAHHRQMTKSRNGNGNGADCPHHVSPAWGAGKTATVGAGLGALLALGGECTRVSIDGVRWPLDDGALELEAALGDLDALAPGERQ